MNYEIVPHKNDILLGRGGKNNQHIGNEQLRILARSQRDQYRTSSKKNKSHISRQLVRYIRNLNPAGRFLKRNTVTGVWEDVGDEIAKEKTSQALRDAVSSSIEPIDVDVKESKGRRAVSAPPTLSHDHLQKVKQEFAYRAENFSYENEFNCQSSNFLHSNTLNSNLKNSNDFPRRVMDHQQADSSAHFASSSCPPRLTSFDKQARSIAISPKDEEAMKQKTSMSFHMDRVSRTDEDYSIPQHWAANSSSQQNVLQSTPTIKQDVNTMESSQLYCQGSPYTMERPDTKSPFNLRFTEIKGNAEDHNIYHKDSRHIRRTASRKESVCVENDDRRKQEDFDIFDGTILKLGMDDADSNHNMSDFDFLDEF